MVIPADDVHVVAAERVLVQGVIGLFVDVFYLAGRGDLLVVGVRVVGEVVLVLAHYQNYYSIGDNRSFLFVIMVGVDSGGVRESSSIISAGGYNSGQVVFSGKAVEAKGIHCLIIIIMGNTIQTEDTSFLQILSPPILLSKQQRINASEGDQIIHHNNNIATQYFIRLISTFQDEDSSSTHQQLLDTLISHKHPFIVPLFYYQSSSCAVSTVSSNVAKMVCNDTHTIQSYYLFCNFSLGQAIKRGFVSYRNPRFKEEEIWYVAGAMVEIVKQLRKMGIAMGGITSKDVMITTDGEIQFYPHKLRIDNSHAVFFKVIKNPKDLSLAYLPPEQLSHLKKASFILPEMITTLIAGDIFCIGMILLECVGFETSERYYNVPKMDLKMESVKIKIRQLRENKIVSERLLGFIEKCVAEQPKNRLSLSQADTILSTSTKSKNLTFIVHDKVDNNLLTTRKSSDLSTFSNVSQSFRIRPR